MQVFFRLHCLISCHLREVKIAPHTAHTTAEARREEQWAAEGSRGQQEDHTDHIITLHMPNTATFLTTTLCTSRFVDDSSLH